MIYRYCRKRPIVLNCILNFTKTFEPCLEQDEIDGKNTFVRIFKNLLEFVCLKDGDQIALFISEKGPECFNARKDNIIACVNETFLHYAPAEKDIDPNNLPTSIPSFVMGPEQCK